jgi:hypothetical protein
MIETISKINAANTIIAKPFPDDMRFRAGHELAKKEAAIVLEKLQKTLAEEVALVAVPVYVSGKNAKALAVAMSEQTPAAVVDLNAIYGTIFESVKRSIGRSQEFGVSQFAIVIQELRQMAVQNNLAAIDIPKFGEPVSIANDEALMATVVRYADLTVGAELAVNYIRKQTGEQAVKAIQEKVPVFPVFVLNAAQKHQELLTKKLFRRSIDAAVEAPTEVNEEAAINALKSIKKTLKNNKE